MIAWFLCGYLVGSIITAVAAMAFFLSSRLARTPVLESLDPPTDRDADAAD